MLIAWLFLNYNAIKATLHTTGLYGKVGRSGEGPMTPPRPPRGEANRKPS